MVGEHSGDISHSDCPSPCPLGFLGILVCLPLALQPTNCLQVLRLTLPVSTASDMSGGFRQGWGRTKAAGGMMSIKHQATAGTRRDVVGQEGTLSSPNHLVVKNNQRLVLPVGVPGRGKELLAAHHLSLAKQELCPPHCSSRPLWEAPAALEMGHSSGTTRPHRSPWDAGVERPTRTLLDPMSPTKCARSPRDTGTAEVASRPSSAPPLHSPLQTPWILMRKTMTTSPAGRTSRSRGCS